MHNRAYSLHPKASSTAKQHPLASITHRRIDLVRGGMQKEIIVDSLTLAKHSLEELGAGEHVLYINTLASHDAIEQAAQKLSARRAAKMIAYSTAGVPLSQKLDFLLALAQEKKVKVVILNSIDFAARSSNQKKALVYFMRELRDMLGCRVIAYTYQSDTPMQGAFGDLKWLCDTVTDIGEWRTGRINHLEVQIVNASIAAEQFVDALQAEEQCVAELQVEEIDGSTDRDAMSSISIDEFLASGSLKTNDLGVERATLEPELEHEEAMELEYA
jgi:hypothetical protein